MTTAQRSPLVPELPTLAETGLPGFDIYTWWGFMAPAGTPQEIIAKWNTEVTRILAHAGDESVLRAAGRGAGARLRPSNSRR